MCGLCGFTGQVINRETVAREMAASITHRGPDDEGYYFDDGIAMAFRRLSIIDLNTGAQPIFNEDRSLVLMFNGEIYNYRQLRDELRSAGHTFSTESDSEVLVHGFEEWGERLPERLRGMFAFAVWNIAEQELFLARDPFGIKPMYYTRLSDGSLGFASEIKCLLHHPHFVKELNAAALDHYLSFQYSLPEDTFFKGVYCLPPAHFLRWRGEEAVCTRYWEATFASDVTMTEEAAVDEIDRAVTDSVEAHRISDVEVGCFLSGGVDSSVVASYFKGQKAFTVGFDGGQHYDESQFAAELAEHLNIEHFVHRITPEEYWEALPTVQYALDQPLADPSCVALYFVSKLAAEHVKVVLSGEGADELFGGYRIYHEPLSLAGYQRLPRWLRKALAATVGALPFSFRGKSFLRRGAMPLEQRFIGNAYMFTQKEKAALLKNVAASDPSEANRALYARCAENDDITRMQYLDIHRWMVGDILLKSDRMSMIHSLEVRVPFLDKEVFGVARRLPTRLKVANGTTKYAFRRASERHLPTASTKRPKLGFPVPMRIWLRQEPYYSRVLNTLTGETAASFFHTDKLRRLMEQHRKGKRDYSRKIWTVYMFLLWYEQYFGEERNEAV